MVVVSKMLSSIIGTISIFLSIYLFLYEFKYLKINYLKIFVKTAAWTQELTCNLTPTAYTVTQYD